MSDALVAQAAHDILARLGPDAGPERTWRVIDELGWPGIGLPEPAGGSGGTLADLCTVIRALAGHPVAVPMVEHALAMWASGEPVPAPATVVFARPGERVSLVDGCLSGEVSRVPWARGAALLLVAVPDSALVVPVQPTAAGVSIVDTAPNLAGEPRGTVRFDAVPVPGARPAAGLFERASLLRTAAMVGAIDRAYALTREHVHMRHQFGRSLAAFQAVAHALAVMASQRALAEVSLAAAAESDTGIAAARVVVGEAATTTARLAHQLHGAIGLTREYHLHHSTRRLLAWRDEFGTQRFWARRLGAEALRADDMWGWITSDPLTGR